MSVEINSADVQRQKIYFLSSLLGSLLLCAAIHFIAPIFVQDRLIRLTMVVLFFTCLASSTWSFSDPYRKYIQCKYRWRYSEGGQSLRHIVERYVISHTQYTSILANLATTCIAIASLGVLAGWDEFQSLHKYQNMLNSLAWICVLSIPVAAVVMSGQLRESFALHKQILEEVQISGIDEKTTESEKKEKLKLKQTAVKVTGAMTFEAGGYEWHWQDYYKNAVIFGQSGSGKTLCILNAILDGLLGSSNIGSLPASGLILDPKGDFKNKIDLLCRKHGRANDLMIIDPEVISKSIHWNPLDSSDDALEVAGRFATVMEILNPSGNQDSFWVDSSRRLVQNLITLLRIARPELPPSLVEIYEAAMSDNTLKKWGKQVEENVLDKPPELQRSLDYFFQLWIPMPADTRATVRSFVANMLGSFLSEPYDTLFSGKSTATISEMIDNGKILYVHMPIADKEVMSRVVSTFVKLEYYREVLKRPDKKRPSFFLCDEFQSFFTAGHGRGDADAFDRTRQSNHANIIAFQNLNTLFKQTDRKEPVLSLLGNCAIKLFLRNTEFETNEYASNLFGEHIETLSSSTRSISNGGRQLFGSSTVSGSAQYASRIKKDEFTKLAVPSLQDNSVQAEAIAQMASRSKVETLRLKWKVHPIIQEK